MQVDQAVEQKFLRTASRSKFEAKLGSDMRALFAILVLLLCLIATRADDPLVIKDSEAVHYWAKMSRCAVLSSPYDQPARDHIYQFRTRIPQSDLWWIHCSRVKNSN